MKKRIVLVLSLLIAGSASNVTQAAPTSGFGVGDCVQPPASRFVSGNLQRGIPDQSFGPNPAIMADGKSGGPTGNKLAPGGAYSVKAESGQRVLLAATKYSDPYHNGAIVGWVRKSDLNTIHPRNCN